MTHPETSQPAPSAALERGLGLWQATALNVTLIVGAGVFGTIPAMLGKLPGPYALLGWLAAGALVLVDGMIWSELGAALPSSGGSYTYLLECYGREKWGRLMAFLFIWQFLISGPLELGSGLVFMAMFSTSLSPGFGSFNQEWTWSYSLWPSQGVAAAVGPSRLLALAAGAAIVLLLYRNIRTLGRLTVTLWVGVLAIIGWVLIEGWLRFDPAVAFDFSGPAATWPDDLGTNLGAAMILAMYSYLGYYNVCYVGDEVRNPGRTIPGAILYSSLLVIVLFTALHLAMLGAIDWKSVPTQSPEMDSYSLPAEFMRRIHGDWAASLMSVLLIWSCFGSVFAGMLGYSRIPYGAARNGHFFAVFRRVHPTKHIPHLSLLLVGAMTLFWSFFDVGSVINALITTRIIEQFIGQVVGVMLLRKHRPDLLRPYRIWLYPLPCLLALAGWVYLYLSAGGLFIALGLATLAAGVVAFFVWAGRSGGWPFAPREGDSS